MSEKWSILVHAADNVWLWLSGLLSLVISYLVRKVFTNEKLILAAQEEVREARNQTNLLREELGSQREISEAGRKNLDEKIETLSTNLTSRLQDVKTSVDRLTDKAMR